MISSDKYCHFPFMSLPSQGISLSQHVALFACFVLIDRTFLVEIKTVCTVRACVEHFEWMARNTTLVVAAGFGAGTEKAFKTTVEIDRLIDNLRSTEYQNVSAYVNFRLQISCCL